MELYSHNLNAERTGDKFSDTRRHRYRGWTWSLKLFDSAMLEFDINVNGTLSIYIFNVSPEIHLVLRQSIDKDVFDEKLGRYLDELLSEGVR